MSERTRFWLITVAALLAMAATASLGRWQLSRAATKEALQASIDARAAEPVLDGASLRSELDADVLLHRRVVARGQWLAERTVLLDNRQMNGRVGFFVVTPLQLESGATVVLVQRGWVPRNFEDRSRVPTVETPTGLVRLEGRIAPPPGKLYAMGAAETGPIRQNLDLAQFKMETGLPLAAVSIQQTDAAADGLGRDWPQGNTGVDKHYGYAFQWFGLSALIAVLYVWFQIVRRFIQRKPA
ncbi:MAG: transmembrane cytochrome oxidase [Curvibacter sp. GWA2_64_110]|nr:MAG: transmembrane cytochrome oxidase [Curvibacter sp. GWA2_64_110]